MDRLRVVRSKRASQNGELNPGGGARKPSLFPADCVTLHSLVAFLMCAVFLREEALHICPSKNHRGPLDAIAFVPSSVSHSLWVACCYPWGLPHLHPGSQPGTEYLEREGHMYSCFPLGCTSTEQDGKTDPFIMCLLHGRQYWGLIHVAGDMWNLHLPNVQTGKIKAGHGDLTLQGTGEGNMNEPRRGSSPHNHELIPL